MRMEVRSKTELNQTGWVGAALLILGPLAVAFSVVMLVTAPRYSAGSNPAQAWGIVCALASILPFVGYVMFSIGKETKSIAVSGEDLK